MIAIPVLYEDSGSPGKVREFGPHVLAIRCLYDRLTGRYGLEKHFDARPRRGVNKLLSDLDHDLGPHVVALIDGDRIRTAIGLEATATLETCASKVAARYKHGTAHISVLDGNIETIVEVLRKCLGDPPNKKDQFMAALNNKDLNARDILLGTTSPSSRECVEKNLPSFAAFVEQLMSLVPSPIAPTP